MARNVLQHIVERMTIIEVFSYLDFCIFLITKLMRSATGYTA